MGGGAGSELPSPGGGLVLVVLVVLPSVVLSARVLVCVQVVSLDPVIEDDAELQKYSKVCWAPSSGSDSGSGSGLTAVVLPTAAAHPHAASGGGAGLLRRAPLRLLCGPWRPRGQTWGPETRG